MILGGTMGNYYCKDSFCPCHQEKKGNTQGWKNEYFNLERTGWRVNEDVLFAFITQTRLDAQREVVDYIRKNVPRLDGTVDTFELAKILLEARNLNRNKISDTGV